MKNRTGAMLVSPTNPLGIELHYHANVFLFGEKTSLYCVCVCVYIYMCVCDIFYHKLQYNFCRQKRREEHATLSTRGELPPNFDIQSSSPENKQNCEKTTQNVSGSEPRKVGTSDDLNRKDTEAEQGAQAKHTLSDTLADDTSEDSQEQTALEMADKISNGDAKSEPNESSAPLIPNSRPSSLINSWRNLTRSISKSSQRDLSPVHTEAQVVSSGDFSVAVVAYKRTTSKDYSKIDIHDHDDDEDHSQLYADISTSWPTTFWTQLTVLVGRTFKQSKPDILSKLNFIQVKRCAVCG